MFFSVWTGETMANDNDDYYSYNGEGRKTTISTIKRVIPSVIGK